MRIASVASSVGSSLANAVLTAPPSLVLHPCADAHAGQWWVRPPSSQPEWQELVTIVEGTKAAIVVVPLQP